MCVIELQGNRKCRKELGEVCHGSRIWFQVISCPWVWAELQWRKTEAALRREICLLCRAERSSCPPAQGPLPIHLQWLLTVLMSVHILGSFMALLVHTLLCRTFGTAQSVSYCNPLLSSGSTTVHPIAHGTNLLFSHPSRAIYRQVLLTSLPKHILLPSVSTSV